MWQFVATITRREASKSIGVPPNHDLAAAVETCGDNSGSPQSMTKENHTMANWHPFTQWEFQDPEMGLLYHLYNIYIRPYFGVYLQFSFLKWPLIYSINWQLQPRLPTRCISAIELRRETSRALAMLDESLLFWLKTNILTRSTKHERFVKWWLS